MRKILIAATLLLNNIAFAAVLTDADMPAMRDALKKSYTHEQCQKDIPNASTETCDCIGKAMAENLSADKLKLCEPKGYEDCVAAEFTAAKASLTEKQINDCKALTEETESESEEE